MATTVTARSFTVRLPADLHRAATDAAARRKLSLNFLLQELVEAYVRQEEVRLLYDSFTKLGEDLEECSVDYAWDVQREAIDRADVWNGYPPRRAILA